MSVSFWVAVVACTAKLSRYLSFQKCADDFQCFLFCLCQNELLDDHLRLEMTRTALQNEPKLIACDTEFHLSKPSYTWNTLRHLSTEHPETSFTLIIGADNWLVFNQWAHHEDILRNYEIIIYPRLNAPFNKQSLPLNAHLLDTPLYNISSTEVRRRIREGENVNQLIPPEIIPLATRYYPHP